MTIAIDYDNTWTRDSKFWSHFCSLCELTGHRIVMLTCRYSNDSFLIRHAGTLDIHFTNGIAKQQYADSIGLSVDVWIDDDPGTICPSKKLSDVPDTSL